MNSRQFHQRRTKSRLWSRFATSQRAMDRKMAASEPGYGDSQWSAWVAVLERRVSRTTSFAPPALASMMRWACGLK